MKKYLPLFLGALAVYLVSTGISFAVFNTLKAGSATSQITSDDTIEPGDDFKVDSSLPKTESCPLNGKLYTKPEKAIWEGRRPLAVMIENHTEARPQSGLSTADIVYEAVAEGGITRFMTVSYCGIAETVEFAPVRSARTYFLDWASEYSSNPLYVHVGGANCSAPKYPDGTYGPCNSDPRTQAIEQIEKYGWGGITGNDLNQFALSFPTCYRNPDRIGRPVATEHQMVCVSNKLYDVAKERGWTDTDEEGAAWDENFRPWKFKDEASLENRGETVEISFSFWEGYSDYDVSWQYDKQNNVYKRVNGGQPHTDLNNNKQITAKNVVVQFTRETGPVDGLKHMLYKTIGEDDALIFANGKVIEGSWKKSSRTARTIFYDKSGKEIEFTRGEIWVEIVPRGNDVEY